MSANRFLTDQEIDDHWTAIWTAAGPDVLSDPARVLALGNAVEDYVTANLERLIGSIAADQTR